MKNTATFEHPILKVCFEECEDADIPIWFWSSCIKALLDSILSISSFLENN
jgi:hypothetical protein